MSSLLRLFIAVDLPDPVRARLQQLQRRLQSAGARVRWVAPGQIHLTLLFLGDTPDGRVPELIAALNETAREQSPFELVAEGTGFFGSARNPRVLWVGLSGSLAILNDLQRNLYGRVRALNIVLEDRPFHPHLTLGRIQPGTPAGALTSALSSISVGPFGSIPVDHIRLIQSTLTPTGARHQVLHSATLKGEP